MGDEGEMEIMRSWHGSTVMPFFHMKHWLATINRIKKLPNRFRNLESRRKKTNFSIQSMSGHCNFKIVAAGRMYIQYIFSINQLVDCYKSCLLIGWVAHCPLVIATVLTVYW